MRELENRTVLITGASAGLGAALARAFADAGARLGLCARREPALREVVEDVRDRGARCVAHALDVRDAAAVERWVEACARELGAPTVLINNASVLGPRAKLAEYPPEQWRDVMDVNLDGAFFATRAALVHMRAVGEGSIVNVSSGAAIPPRDRWGAYAVSKAALEAFSQNLALELRDAGVRVNLVDPGAMRTTMRADAYPEEDPLTLKTPDDTTGVFLWLASARSGGISGERFRADRWPDGEAGR